MEKEMEYIDEYDFVEEDADYEPTAREEALRDLREETMRSIANG